MIQVSNSRIEGRLQVIIQRVRNLLSISCIKGEILHNSTFPPQSLSLYCLALRNRTTSFNSVSTLVNRLIQDQEMLKRRYIPAIPIRAPVPTTTTVAPRLRPTPSGPSQLGASVRATAGRLMLAFAQAPSKPVHRRDALDNSRPITQEGIGVKTNQQGRGCYPQPGKAP
jgi:hypothetical protein